MLRETRLTSTTGLSHLSTVQRLVLFYRLQVSHTFLTKDWSYPDVVLADFLNRGCRADDFIRAGVTVSDIVGLGAKHVADFIKAGYTSLHLNNVCVREQLVCQLGKQIVLQAFAKDANDAVALAGEPAFHLGLGLNDMLKLCLAAPVQAVGVLQQADDGSSFLDIEVIIRSGMRKADLGSTRITATSLMQRTKCSYDKLQYLGFGTNLFATSARP